MPLTVDSRAALMYLNTVNTDMVQTQGTAIGEALTAAKLVFDNGGESSGNNRAVILITDGESHDEDAPNAASELADMGVHHHRTIGVGTEKGAPHSYGAKRRQRF